MYSITVAKMQSKSIASIKICHKDYIIIYIVGVHSRNHTFSQNLFLNTTEQLVQANLYTVQVPTLSL